MDTKNYLYLLSIERFRSVSRAAKELGITPQGLARAVRRMEEELSCTMYEGALGASDLTEQGKCVLEHGQAIVDEERGMRCALTPSMPMPLMSFAWVARWGYWATWAKEHCMHSTNRRTVRYM